MTYAWCPPDDYLREFYYCVENGAAVAALVSLDTNTSVVFEPVVPISPKEYTFVGPEHKAKAVEFVGLCVAKAMSGENVKWLY